MNLIVTDIFFNFYPKLMQNSNNNYLILVRFSKYFVKKNYFSFGNIVFLNDMFSLKICV